MPRLLLVDDNPSIHRIAESLLAPTDVELTCVASAAEALDRIGRGERFDVGLIDTAMPGMDGWTLLSRFRDMAETARMPIALMAGVLDPVDPTKLAQAPIQGFLKKPIELRELGDRVKALLATPVAANPSPFSTVPATPSKDLLKHAEASLPEFRPDPVEVPTGLVGVDLNLPEPEDDLLVLTAEDLWPEDPPTAIPEPEPEPLASILPDVHLELEELDLDSLQDLTLEPLSEGGRPSEFLSEPLTTPQVEHTPSPEEDHILTLSGLEELETRPADFLEAPHFPASAPVLEPEAKPEAALAHLPAATTLVEIGGAAGVAAFAAHAFGHEAHDSAPAVHESVPAVHEPLPVAHEPLPAAHELAPRVPEAPSEIHEPAPVAHESEAAIHEPAPAVVHEAPAESPEPLSAAAHEPVASPSPEPVPHVEIEELPPASAASGQMPAADGHDAPAAAPGSAASEQALAVVQAMLADPALVDALAKAVVAHLGDQVLREIAWEVMPDLAGRLQR
jgi:CheY-like chemotaxis protein